MNIQPSAWSLNDLFPDPKSQELERAFSSLEEHVINFEKFRPQLTPDIPTSNFIEMVHDLEEGTRLASKLYSFAELSFAANTQDKQVQTLLGRIQQFMAEMENRTIFFTLWWKNLDEANASRLMTASGDYLYYLEVMRKFKPHTLSEPEEKVVNLKNVTGKNALVTLYDAITNRYVFKVEREGELTELTRGELMSLVRMPDPSVRARAYQELYRVYEKDNNILGQMFQSVVRDWQLENINLRGFSSPIAARNLENDIPDTAVDILLNVANQNSAIFQRFFNLKARLLGMEKLRRYDIYAPVVKSDKKYDYKKAVDIVLDSFTSFHPEFGKLAERVIDENHMDSEIRKGKQSGAFCASVVPGLTPWVKINYQGYAEDVATMAHELGHAIHSMLAKEHSMFTFHSSLPLAETASTFGEMLLVDNLLKNENDEGIRRDLLFKQIDDSYATIMRQSFFAMFEQEAHELVHDNASVDDLASAYMKNLHHQFGDAVDIGDEFTWEWIAIPHFFHTPFYVYAYAFGQLLVLSLFNQFKEEGDSFKSRYIKMLAHGGSKSPTDICADAGIDILSQKFWQGGYDVIEHLVCDLENIN